ncbi:CrcB family protein [Paucilactobacillus suebicus]|uniref:Fluoride-specific ion channel FluC n=1 Tax=Paucilactobacillus suebicus DSM 5007 = KCTC 3549 TaxID=1423807 RepID=A0A0R1W2Y3_9LACO|nr:CrcB family protein [Paucilactobacillus suebicus]KRM11965.1 camphor resistance protein CrcB [Paucilactobacillus suebicus DSM 5007 = KCTC 3549]
MVRKYIAVFLFGCLGGLTRLGITHLPFSNGQFPIGTILVNLLGCLLFPLVVYLIAFTVPLPSAVITGLSAGFVASLTTFSSLNLDGLKLFMNHQYILLGSYLTLNIIGGLIMSLIGLRISRRLVKQREAF